MTNPLTSAQTDLNKRRAPSTMRSIADINPLDAQPIRNHEPLPPSTAVKPRLQRVTLNTLDVTHDKVLYAVRMARAWAKRKRQGYADASLILCGPNGVGKTHIAKAIWWSIVLREVGLGGDPSEGDFERPMGTFFVESELVSRLGTTVDNGQMINPNISNLLRVGTRGDGSYDAPMVVIDEVGERLNIPFVASDDQLAEYQARMYKVVDFCYRREVSIIMTTNLPIAKLAIHLGARCWDRLAEMAPRINKDDSFIVDMFGVPSYRMKLSGRAKE